MAARTRAQLIRPGKAPIIGGADLAELVQEIAEAGLIGHHTSQFVQLRYGRRIDSDKKVACDYHETSVPGIVRVQNYPWDSELDAGHVDVVRRHLELHPHRIYRAAIGLGEVDDAIAAYLTREPHPANQTAMRLSTLSLEVGAICVGSPHIRPAHVGWISFEIAGRGYPYPWTEQELIYRIRQVEVIQYLEQILQARWPVTHPPGLLDKIAWKKIANRMDYVSPGQGSWIWAVSSS